MNKRIPILMGLILVAIAVWLQVSHVRYLQHYIDRFENIAYDIQLRTMLLANPKPLNTSVVIVDIDDKSLINEGRWPWPRSKIATLISRIQEEGAVVVALDMMFTQPENNIALDVLDAANKYHLNTPTIDPILKKMAPYFDNDALLATSLKKIDAVLGISFTPKHHKAGIIVSPVIKLTTPEEKSLEFFELNGYLGNNAILQNAAKSSGFINAFADEDGTIRRAPLLLRYHDELYPSLALEAVHLFLLNNLKLSTEQYGDSVRLEGVLLGDYLIPTDERGQVIIPFRGGSFTFPFYSATDVLNKKIPAGALQGKIVFIGPSATGLGDLKPTSVQNIFPGVEIQATIADGILNKNFSYKPPWSLGAEIFLTILCGGFFAILFPYLGPRLITLMVIVVPLLLLFGNNWLWTNTGLIISIFIPIALSIVLASVNIIYGYLFETRKRERLKTMFGQYVPEKHIDEMLKSTGNYGMLGEDREMTVLFADIRNFTGISENLSAANLKELLNDFFNPMTEIIFKHRGTIDKYIGDLVMAFWGAPIKDKRHAQHAITSALEMQEKVAQLNPALQSRGWPELKIGIGLNTGMMSVGDMGSKYRRNYTVLGDAVNLASRVEGLTKYYGVPVIATEFTMAGQKNFIFRELDRVKVKGKEKGVRIFEVVCHKNTLTPALEQEIKTWELILHYYFNRDWNKAKELLLDLRKTYSHAKLYQVYMERLVLFEKKPPPEEWGGMFTHAEK